MKGVEKGLDPGILILIYRFYNLEKLVDLFFIIYLVIRLGLIEANQNFMILLEVFIRINFDLFSIKNLFFKRI